ncbi:MAG: choline monooxygenase [Solirubrobacteraceae bacterium]|jgi:choline monooxygenase|nr:choline monooxygenase [Solirubrobacteraceae bacterium]
MKTMSSPVSSWDDLGVERSGTLPADWYTSRELFELEREHLFRRVWQQVGRTEQVAEPGDYFTCEVAGEPILVVRDKAGELHALSNVCRHRAGPVAMDCGRRKAFQCPYHGWTYELDGRIRTTQGMDGTEDFDPSAMRLPEFRVETWGPLVWVALSDDVPSLAEWLGAITPRMGNYRLEELEYVGGRRWYIPCNWKLYVDNYMEGYHIPFIHPGLNQALSPDVYTYKLGTWSNEQYGAEPHPRGPGSRVASVLGSLQSFRTLKPPMAGLDEDERNGYFFFWLFPTNTFNFMPDAFLTMTVRPVDVEMTECTFSWWMPEATDLTDRLLQAAVVNFGHLVNLEDVEICMHAQRGMRSSEYRQGRYNANQEMCLHHFHQLLSRHMAPHLGNGAHDGAANGNGSAAAAANGTGA